MSDASNATPAAPGPYDFEDGVEVPLEHTLQFYFPDLEQVQEDEDFVLPPAEKHAIPKLGHKKDWGSLDASPLHVLADADEAKAIALPELWQDSILPPLRQDADDGADPERRSLDLYIRQAVQFIGNTWLKMVMVQHISGERIVRVMCRSLLRTVSGKSGGATGTTTFHNSGKPVQQGGPATFEFTEEEWVALEDELDQFALDKWWRPLNDLRLRTNVESYNHVAAACFKWAMLMDEAGDEDLSAKYKDLVQEMSMEAFDKSVNNMGKEYYNLGRTHCTICQNMYDHGCDDPVLASCPTQHTFGRTCLKVHLITTGSHACPVCGEPLL